MRRWAAIILLLLAGCSPGGTDRSDDQTAAARHERVAAEHKDNARHEAGRGIYNFRCYYCHGYSGDGRTLAASFLDPVPRNFAATHPAQLARSTMLDAVRHGRTGTAMRGFRGILSEEEMALVTDFVRQEFLVAKAPNTRYHTEENGWPGHARYRAAFPFATGELALDTPEQKLDADQARGRGMFLTACVSCHDRGRVTSPGETWRLGARQEGVLARANYGGYTPPASAHDKAPRLNGLTRSERRGERLYQSNCAFCHAPDGTGRNWIGAFLRPNPPDFNNLQVMDKLSAQSMKRAIRDGLPQTSMPAWKSVLGDADVDAIVAYIDRAFRPKRAL